MIQALKKPAIERSNNIIIIDYMDKAVSEQIFSEFYLHEKSNFLREVVIFDIISSNKLSERE